jgi:hypothetical protein
LRTPVRECLRRGSDGRPGELFLSHDIDKVSGLRSSMGRRNLFFHSIYPSTLVIESDNIAFRE